MCIVEYFLIYESMGCVYDIFDGIYVKFIFVFCNVFFGKFEIIEDVFCVCLLMEKVIIFKKVIMFIGCMCGYKGLYCYCVIFY